MLDWSYKAWFNQNMAFLLNVIATAYISLQKLENIG